MTAGVVARLRALLEASSGRRDVFAKVGDSITASGHFLYCLAGNDLRWGEHASLEATRAFFSKTPADGARSSFARVSAAAEVGWLTTRPLEGTRPPLTRELDEIRPAWAVVMMGTNDTYPDSMHGFQRSLSDLIGALLEAHVVPLISTIPPRRESPASRAEVLEMNQVVRAVAQDLQLPLMDLFGALDPLPHAGLMRDGVHPRSHDEGGLSRPCWFEGEALSAGMNQRNLLVLEALDRVRRKVLGDEPPEVQPPEPEGDGSPDRPFAVASLPFVDGRDAREAPPTVADSCGDSPRNHAFVYAITLAKPARLRARVFSAERGVDMDLRLLPDGKGCGKRADRTLDADAPAGTHLLFVEPARRKGGPRPGRFRLSIMDLSGPR